MDWGGLKLWQLAELALHFMGDLMEAKTCWFGTLNTGLDVIDIYSGIVDGNLISRRSYIWERASWGTQRIQWAKVGPNLHVWTDAQQEFAARPISRPDQLYRSGELCGSEPLGDVEEVGKATLKWAVVWWVGSHYEWQSVGAEHGEN